MRRLSARGYDVLLSIAAGIMLAATLFALLAPAIEVAHARTGAATGAAAIVCGGFVIGVGALWVAHAESLLPWVLAFAGGFVIVGEIIPATRRSDRGSGTKFAVVGGFVVTIALDVVLG